MAPPDLFSHMEAAPALRHVLPSVHRVVDTTTEEPALPVVDEEGRSLHAILRRDAVMADLAKRGGALVWETSPAIGVVRADDGRCIVVRGGRNGRCVLVDHACACAMVAQLCVSGCVTTACNVFYDE